MKRCCRCKTRYPLFNFHKSTRNIDGLRGYCKSCSTEMNKEYYHNNKEKEAVRQKIWNDNNKESRALTHRKNNYKRNYGITIEEYEEMLDEQDGKCSICNTDTPSDGKRLHIDHNHNTGKVRGLLCNNCNHGLGQFKDNQNLLAMAIQYLKIYEN